MVSGIRFARNKNHPLIKATPKHGCLVEFGTAKKAKLVAGTNKHTMNAEGDLLLSDVEEDEAIIEDE